MTCVVEGIEMKILIINCGSSSIKYQLLDMEGETVITKGLVERIGLKESVLKYNVGDAQYKIEQDIAGHSAGISLVLDVISQGPHKVIDSLNEISAVGHRVTHGGEFFKDSVVITDEVIDGIKACIPIAPLHNPANLEGIYACSKLMKHTPQVAVFDTAFHQTMPQKAYMYGLPYDLYKKYGVRRYGFHGTSHRFVMERTAELMGKKPEDLKIVVCHLGNGASVTAIKNGKSVDTSMGFTPLDGLIMGTRCGEIDPALVGFIMEHEDMTVKQISRYLNSQSGVLGLSGISSDFRDLEDAALAGDERAEMTIDTFAYQVEKYIGGYIMAMDGVDAIAFTAGLGENSPYVRGKICADLGYLGTKIDPIRNERGEKTRKISTDDSKVAVYIVPTNEELMIARECKRILNK